MQTSQRGCNGFHAARPSRAEVEEAGPESCTWPCCLPESRRRHARDNGSSRRDDPFSIARYALGAIEAVAARLPIGFPEQVAAMIFTGEQSAKQLAAMAKCWYCAQVQRPWPKDKRQSGVQYHRQPAHHRGAVTRLLPDVPSFWRAHSQAPAGWPFKTDNWRNMPCNIESATS